LPCSRFGVTSSHSTVATITTATTNNRGSREAVYSRSGSDRNNVNSSAMVARTGPLSVGGRLDTIGAPGAACNVLIGPDYGKAWLCPKWRRLGHRWFPSIARGLVP